MAFTLRSEAFQPGQNIPPKYTCDGADISPPLNWTDVPQEAQSLALLCDDPDSARNPWSHWVLYDLPSGTHKLPEGYPPGAEPDPGGKQGRNDFGDVAYGGPCPGLGPAHHYHFRLYALDQKLDLPPGATRAQLLDRMEGFVLAETELVGLYARS